jgi:hypothetical protein
MPFRSEAQRKWMYANDPAMAAEWQKKTPKGKKLPMRVEKKADFVELLQAAKGLGNTKLSAARIALDLLTKSSAIPIPAGSAYRRMDQPPGMRAEQAVQPKPNALARLLNLASAGLPPKVAPQVPRPQPQTPVTNLDAIHKSLRGEADQLVAEHPSLGGQMHEAPAHVREFGMRGEDAAILQHARQNMPTQEVPNAPFSQFIQDFKRKQMAPLW